MRKALIALALIFLVVGLAGCVNQQAQSSNQTNTNQSQKREIILNLLNKSHDKRGLQEEKSNYYIKLNETLWTKK